MKKGLSGVKPYDVCSWLFDVLGMEPGDEFVDMFYGSGAVTSAFQTWKKAKEVKQYLLNLKEATGL
jgi:hypothetical protein